MEAEKVDLRNDIAEWKPGNVTLTGRLLGKEMGHGPHDGTSFRNEWNQKAKPRKEAPGRA
jgi:hypothetical protein